MFTKQQELKIGADGQAGPTFRQRIGVIFTHEITAATVAGRQGPRRGGAGAEPSPR